MMGGGTATAGPPRPQWDYLFTDRPGSADDFKKALRTQGSEGWEYCGTGPGEALGDAEPDATVPASHDGHLPREVERIH